MDGHGLTFPMSKQSKYVRIRNVSWCSWMKTNNHDNNNKKWQSHGISCMKKQNYMSYWLKNVHIHCYHPKAFSITTNVSIDLSVVSFQWMVRHNGCYGLCFFSGVALFFNSRMGSNDEKKYIISAISIYTYICMNVSQKWVYKRLNFGLCKAMHFSFTPFELTWLYVKKFFMTFELWNVTQVNRIVKNGIEMYGKKRGDKKDPFIYSLYTTSLTFCLPMYLFSDLFLSFFCRYLEYIKIFFPFWFWLIIVLCINSLDTTGYNIGDYVRRK